MELSAGRKGPVVAVPKARWAGGGLEGGMGGGHVTEGKADNVQGERKGHHSQGEKRIRICSFLKARRSGERKKKKREAGKKCRSRKTRGGNVAC